MFEAYRITSPYGPRISPVKGTPEKHTGIDLVKKLGGKNAPIEAFVAGKVVWVKEVPKGVTGTGFGNFGLVVAIVDKYNALHMYAHLHGALVEVGDQVKQDQVIGHQGRTGQGTGEHLHYEVRKNASAPSHGFGTDTEPTAYLAQYFAKEPKPAPTFEQALQELVAKGVTKSPDYWANVAAHKEDAKPEYVDGLLKNMAAALGKKTDSLETALAILQVKGVTNNPAYWAEVAVGKQRGDGNYIAQLLKNLAAKI